MGDCIKLIKYLQVDNKIMIVYGVISYILIILMIVGYILVKRWGDKQQPQNYSDFQ